MKTCSCDRKYFNEIHPGSEGEIRCSNCDGVRMCDFGGDPRHPAFVATSDSYSCWEHVDEAKARAQEEESPKGDGSPT